MAIFTKPIQTERQCRWSTGWTRHKSYGAVGSCGQFNRRKRGTDARGKNAVSYWIFKLNIQYSFTISLFLLNINQKWKTLASTRTGRRNWTSRRLGRISRYTTSNTPDTTSTSLGFLFFNLSCPRSTTGTRTLQPFVVFPPSFKGLTNGCQYEWGWRRYRKRFIFLDVDLWYGMKLTKLNTPQLPHYIDSRHWNCNCPTLIYFILWSF